MCGRIKAGRLFGKQSTINRVQTPAARARTPQHPNTLTHVLENGSLTAVQRVQRVRVSAHIYGYASGRTSEIQVCPLAYARHRSTLFFRPSVVASASISPTNFAASSAPNLTGHLSAPERRIPCGCVACNACGGQCCCVIYASTCARGAFRQGVRC